MKKAIGYLLLFLITAAAATFAISAWCYAFAEEEEAWIICQPGSYVNVRESPKKSGTEMGRLELGDKVTTDGKTKNGYSHCVDLSMEQTEGWIFTGYLTDEEPEIMDAATFQIRAGGRTASRRWVDGPVRKWIQPGKQVKVYAMNSTWAVTNRGFIRSDFIEEAP